MPLIESNEQESCDNTDNIPSGTGVLEKLVSSVRDSLGLELSPCTPIAEDQYAEDTLSERTGFLRMVNRQHIMNSSNYSLSSVFSLGSVGGSVASLQGNTLLKPSKMIIITKDGFRKHEIKRQYSGIHKSRS